MTTLEEVRAERERRASRSTRTSMRDVAMTQGGSLSIEDIRRERARRAQSQPPRSRRGQSRPLGEEIMQVVGQTAGSVLPFQEEIGGAMVGVGNAVSEGLQGRDPIQGYQRAYRGAVDNVRTVNADLMERRPVVANLAIGTGSAAPILTGIGATPSIANAAAQTTRGAPLLMRQMGEAGTVGALQAYAYGAGARDGGNLQERVQAGNEAAPVGFGLGVAAPVAVNAVSATAGALARRLPRRGAPPAAPTPDAPPSAPGGGPEPLPQSPPREMGRASDGEFNIDAYHATNSAFDSFDPGMRGSRYNNANSRQAFFFGATPDLGAYADGVGGNIRPERLRIQNPRVIEGPMQDNRARPLDEARAAGHDGVIWTEGGKPYAYAVFDHANIRNRFEQPTPPPRQNARASDGSVLPVRPAEPGRQSFVGGGDDLAEAARMRPPSEEWTDAFHGTSQDVQWPPRRSGSGALGPGFYVARNPATTENFAGVPRQAGGGVEFGSGSNIMPVQVRGRMATPQQWDDAVGEAVQRRVGPYPESSEVQDAAVEALRSRGFAGVEDPARDFVNIFDPQTSARPRFRPPEPQMQSQQRTAPTAQQMGDGGQGGGQMQSQQPQFGVSFAPPPGQFYSNPIPFPRMTGGGGPRRPAAPSGPPPIPGAGRLDTLARRSRRSADQIMGDVAAERANPQGRRVVDLFGDAGVRQARPIVQSPGRTGALASDVADQRFQAAPEILVGELRRRMGVGESRQAAMARLGEEYQQASANLYNPMFERPLDPAAQARAQQRIAELTDDPVIAEAERRARAIFDRDRRTGLVQGSLEDNYARALHYMKMGVDEAISAERRNPTGAQATEMRGIQELRRQFVDLVDQTIPGYREARQEWGGLRAAEDALEEGAGFLRLPSDEVRARVGEMTTFELDHARIGLAHELEQKIGLAGNVDGRNNVANIQALRSPEMRRRLEAVFPSVEAAEAFFGTASTQNQLMRNASAWGGNSQTQGNLAYQADGAAQTAMEVGGNIATGNIGRAASVLGRKAVNAITDNAVERSNDAFGETLFRDLSDAEFVAQFERILRDSEARASRNTRASTAGAAAAGGAAGRNRERR